MAVWRAAFGFGLLCLLPAAVLSGEFCQAYVNSYGVSQPAQNCPFYCCGDCTLRYCCYNPLSRLDEAQQLQCDEFDGSFGTLIAIGVTVCAVIIVTIVLCLTCSCCCLYKACRRPRPVVATTTATTVVHAPYPQQPAVPPGYPAAPYQGYQPMPVQPQPGMPVAPYPAQYPPPYPTQPSGPPAYHETMAAGAGAPYPISQPPYNPAYMDPQKPTY
ncbi:protein shisa-5 isoform X1 [Colius striatus]|uniref:protein shisa-5 isoform X1 n=1 Tax=Colius striatus TaxID=57412 RepID=UPI002B1CE52C|nr:protein shisa-5 isoform X1 [Colius striatus]